MSMIRQWSCKSHSRARRSLFQACCLPTLVEVSAAVTRHSNRIQCMSVACLSRLDGAKLDVTEMERVWEWLHCCLSWSQRLCMPHWGGSVRNIAEYCNAPRTFTRNTAVLPAAAGTMSVTCTAASGIWSGLIGLKKGRRTLAEAQAT